MHFIPYNQFIICTFATYRKELRITLKQTWHSASGINNLKKTHYTKEGIYTDIKNIGLIYLFFFEPYFHTETFPYIIT